MAETKWYWAIMDGWTMTRRNLKHIFRNAESLLMSIVLPVALMLMFVYIFGGAIQTGTDYINYVVPGVIITCVAFGSSLIAIDVTQDMTGGLFERLRSMPVLPSSLLIGHVIGGMSRNGIATTITFLVAVLIGFRPNAGPLEWIGVIGVLALFMLSISWLFVLIGLIVKSVDTANALTFPMLFLPYISSAFVPTDTMPDWLHVFADNQPMTPLIETLRGLLTGAPIDNNLWLTIAWFGGLLIISFVTATMIFKNRKSE
ncbi:ABC transporter permease [Virgibacillus oceani]